ncbi:WecB/TagA/CpsF family glycosyltransferase [Aquimarina sp. W85]|uniref:WecB/TagA/CpsF family glycosyltransferase n=1 Tax=Aquimarina rhodophyticola TaxID=3342246 RepID=UPI00366FB171
MRTINHILKQTKVDSLGRDIPSTALCTFLNPYSYKLLRKSKVLMHFDIIYFDGISLVKLLQTFGIKIQRNSFDMTSLAPKVFANAIADQKMIYIVGSTEIAIQQFREVILRTYPNLPLKGWRHGYFQNIKERQKTLEEIKALSPEIVIAGMGTPYQEDFLIELRNLGWEGTGYTCGGFIHQTAAGIQYYPQFYDRYNLRWLYRIIDEPKLFKRYFWHYPIALFLFIKDLMFYKFLKPKNS